MTPLDVVLDADRDEGERVAWLSRLREERDPDVLCALVPVLNEPLEWLGRELAALLQTRGVLVCARDAHLVPCPDPADALVPDGAGLAHSAAHGLAVLPDDVELLTRHLAVRPPWLRCGPHGRAWLKRLDAPHVVRVGDGFTRRVTVGRALDCDVVVSRHVGAGRHHTQLSMRGGALVAADMRTMGGTRVDGVRVDIATVPVGSRITVGKLDALEVLAISPDVETWGAEADDELPIGARTFTADGHTTRVGRHRYGVVAYDAPSARTVERVP